jgi:phage-related minor tail protein
MFDNIPYLPYVLSAFIGIGLAAASGFRVFLPMFAVSLASFMGWIPMNDTFTWLAGLPTLITTGIATVVEILAYYIPYVDHLLDTMSVPLATVAGSVLFASQFADLGTFPQWALALIAGGGTAAVISSGFAGTRAASTATTGGLGNSVVATTETAGAGIMSVLALAAPVIAAIAAVALVTVVFVMGRRLWNRFRNFTSDRNSKTIDVEVVERKHLE